MDQVEIIECLESLENKPLNTDKIMCFVFFFLYIGGLFYESEGGFFRRVQLCVIVSITADIHL